MKRQLSELWSLLITEDQHALSKRQVEDLLAAKHEFLHLMKLAESRLREGLEELQRYRVRKAEIEQLPPEQLDEMIEEMYKRVCAGRSQLPVATAEEGSSSLFEPVALDSDDHILYELLQGKKGQPGQLQLV